MTASDDDHHEHGYGHHHHHHSVEIPPPPPFPTPQYYGTFQENPTFPQPVHPHDAHQAQQQQQQQRQQQQQQQRTSSQGYERIDSGTHVSVLYPVHRQKLPLCGLGIGWFLFILGFFTFSAPWFVGAFIFFFLAHDSREHVGLAACVAAALIAILVGGVKGFHLW